MSRLAEETDVTPPRAQGRPRDASRDPVILDAVLELVAEVGYDRVSMDAVAARARASKATIYRRWPSKGALVAAAVRCRAAMEPLEVDEGSLRADLLVAVRILAENLVRQDLGLMTGVFAAMRTDAELASALRCDMFTDKASVTAPVFRRAAARGEPLHPDANLLFGQVAPAVVIHRLLATDEGVDEAFLTCLVDSVLLPVLTHQPTSPSDTPTPVKGPLA